MDSRQQCVVAGGGPAGLVLGYLLARSGVRVAVLEKHDDFLRDFRGDTIHPSTLTVLQDVGLLERFLELPHDEVAELSGDVFGEIVTIADFRRLPAPRPFLVLVPQWDFLDFIAGEARRFPNFTLHMGAKAESVLEEGGRVVGVRGKGHDGAFEIRADLVVAADGRHTTIRDSAGLNAIDVGAPIDVLWFHLPRDPQRHPSRTGGIIRAGAILVMLNRQSYWQCAYVIPKGGFETLQAEGLQRFRERLATVAPFFAPDVATLETWDAIKLLTVQITDLEQWHRDGLLVIGDAAHAMSPVGGVGINLAIQDAVAAANLLAEPLRGGRLEANHLAAVEKRRHWPARVTQRAQVAIQDTVLSPVLARTDAPAGVPLPLKLLQRFPRLRSLPARLVGIGVRPERVRVAPHPAA
ncbi:FAD-dependent oxidoreductase [Ramlibacter algicola]|uniref:FAD-dependent oxidoreductase n=1 Tax=Ramlibacter algicola TaxID=2795217 RepID=A0A934Q0B5_9BURK|nr:FAD-dependent oxidoreductase [Ramlibacter algicola]MBK0392373.1 FAD-dependent oxidoreductase [Ramlibacter algicola]